MFASNSGGGGGPIRDIIFCKFVLIVQISCTNIAELRKPITKILKLA